MDTAQALKQDRMAQLVAMDSATVTDLVNAIRADCELPNVDYHYRKHHFEFDRVPDVAAYLREFAEHQKCSKLRLFTFLRPSDRSRMWYTVDEAAGTVGLFNESRMRNWSFFRPSDLQAFLKEQHFLVEAVPEDGTFRFR